MFETVGATNQHSSGSSPNQPLVSAVCAMFKVPPLCLHPMVNPTGWWLFPVQLPINWNRFCLHRCVGHTLKKRTVKPVQPTKSCKHVPICFRTWNFLTFSDNFAPGCSGKASCSRCSQWNTWRRGNPLPCRQLFRVTPRLGCVVLVRLGFFLIGLSETVQLLGPAVGDTKNTDLGGFQLKPIL